MPLALPLPSLGPMPRQLLLLYCTNTCFTYFIYVLCVPKLFVFISHRYGQRHVNTQPCTRLRFVTGDFGTTMYLPKDRRNVDCTYIRLRTFVFVWCAYKKESYTSSQCILVQYTSATRSGYRQLFDKNSKVVLLATLPTLCGIKKS